MKIIKKIIVILIVVILILGVCVYIDYFNTKTNNTSPKISIKEDLDDDTVLYKAIFYKVWYCKSNNAYLIGSYDDKDAICPKNYKYVDGYYTNELNVKISKRDLQLLTSTGIYTSDMIESISSELMLENYVHVAFNYEKNKYKETNQKSSDGYKIIEFKTFKEVDNYYKWVDDEETLYCLKEDKEKKYYSILTDNKCGKFEELKMDKRWCDNYKNSTLIYEEGIENYCKE